MLIPRLGLDRTVSLIVVGAAVCAIAYANSPSILLALFWILPLSGLHTGILAGTISLLQERISANIRGSAIGIYMMSKNLAYAGASAALAILADYHGLQSVLTFAAVTMLLVITARLLRSKLSQSLDAVENVS